MSRLAVLVCLQACLAQIAFSQYIPSGSIVANNALVSNSVDYNNYGGFGGFPINAALSGVAVTGAGNTISAGNTGVSLGGLGSGLSGLSLGGLGSPLAVGNGLSLGGFGGLGAFGGYGLDGFGTGVSVSGLGLGNGLAGVSVGAPVSIGGFGSLNAPISPLSVTTIAPFGPSGLALASENELYGVLDVIGQAPFQSAMAFQGALPTAGSGVASCGCGNGQVGIIGDGPGVFPLLPGYGGLPGYGPAPYPLPGYGIGPGFASVYA